MINLTTNTTVEASCPQCGAEMPMPDYADVGVCAYCGSTLARSRDRRSEIDQDRRPEEQTLHSVQCTQCAGPLKAREGRRILVCSRCGVRVAVREHSGFSRWHFPCRVSRVDAAAAGAAWLKSYPGLAKEARDARFLQARLFYVPVWEYRALVAGWEFGYKLRTRCEVVGSGWVGYPEDAPKLEVVQVREGVEEPCLQERRLYQAAADFGALGARRPRISGRELVLPLLAGELEPGSTVLEAKGSAAAVAEKGRQAVAQPVATTVTTGSHMFAVRESTTLLYYPLWLVRYQYGSAICRLVVNGRNGNVNAARAPASNAKRVALLVAQVGVLAAAAIFLVWLALTLGSGRASLVAGAVIVSVVAILLVWRFRVVKEVEYHEPLSS